MTRRTEIKIETHRITIIRTSGTPFSVHCETCGRQVSAFGGELTNALRLSVSEMETMRQTGEIHFVASNSELVCGNSFAEVLRRINQ